VSTVNEIPRTKAKCYYLYCPDGRNCHRNQLLTTDI